MGTKSDTFCILTTSRFREPIKNQPEDTLQVGLSGGGGGKQRIGACKDDPENRFSLLNSNCSEARKPSKRYKIRHVLGHIRHPRLVRHDDSVDDVNDSITTLDVGRYDVGTVDHYFSIGYRYFKLLPINSFR